jgi:hypothetical protein
MAHPDFVPGANVPNVFKQGRSLVHLNKGAAKLAVVGTFGLAAILDAHRHLAVADAEHRHAKIKHALRRARRSNIAGGGRAA